MARISSTDAKVRVLFSDLAARCCLAMLKNLSIKIRKHNIVIETPVHLLKILSVRKLIS